MAATFSGVWPGFPFSASYCSQPAPALPSVQHRVKQNVSLHFQSGVFHLKVGHLQPRQQRNLGLKSSFQVNCQVAITSKN